MTAFAQEEMQFEDAELRTVEEYQSLTASATELLGKDQHHEALLKLVEVTDTGDEAEGYYREAEYLMGVALYRLGFSQSSYTYFERVLDAEPRHARYNDVLPWLVAVHRKTPGETLTLERMAEYEEAAYNKELKSEINFYVGQFHYYQGNLDEALRALGQVKNENQDVYLRARYLEGVTHVRKNAAIPASKSMKAILRYEKDKGIKGEVGAKLYRMALLSMARIYYTIAGPSSNPSVNYRAAIRYYNEIPEYSPDWLESLLEVSWSNFQIDNYGRSLGNLHTLNSPYFEEEYFPEALVLESVILYRHCHYDETLRSIDRFIKSYRDLWKELDTQLKVPRDPNQFYAWLARMSQQGADLSLRLKRIFNAALADRKLNRSFRFILHLNREIHSLKKLSQNASMTALAASLLAELSAFRELVLGEVGALARSRLQSVHRDLRRHLTDALKVKFETLSAQKRDIEQNRAVQENVGISAGSLEIDKEHMYWPFEGEYWKDELGSYTVAIQSRCSDAK
jgi:tetratricopeptide (TPR) repeat protein